MKYRRIFCTLLCSTIVLCALISCFAQQLPEIIWNKEAQRPESSGFSSTYSIEFSPDGQRVYAGGNRRIGSEVGSITIFNFADGADLRSTPTYFPIASVNELSISPDGLRIATAHNDVQCDHSQTNCRYAYILYDAQQLTRLAEPQTSFYPASSVDNSPDNQLVAVGDGSPNNIKILNAMNFSLLRSWPGHTVNGSGRTMSLRFSPDGQLLASGGGDDKVKIWRVSDGGLLRTLDFNSPQVEVFSVAFSPDGEYIAATDRSSVSKVKIWRLSDGALVRTFINPEFNSTVSNKVTWTRDGRYVVSAVVSGHNPSRIRFWNFATQELVREYIGASLNNAINTLEFAPDGRSFAFGYGSRVILARNPFAPAKTVADFDGDGRSDPAVFRDGTWFRLESTNGFVAAQFGLASDRITPGDFDGDGKTDVAVFRDGTWFWLNSSNGSFNAYQFGIASDVPLPTDFTGDGRAELAVYRGGIWYMLDLAANQFQIVQFGISSDKPVPADFDGDGKTDVAVYRDGIWHYLRSSDKNYHAVQFGIAGDIPAAGDYDGDSKADQAVYRNGDWHVLGSRQGYFAVNFGIAADIPVPADYDGDGKTDAAVYRDGIWYMLRSQQGFGSMRWGLAGDRPAQAAWVY